MCGHEVPHVSGHLFFFFLISVIACFGRTLVMALELVVSDGSLVKRIISETIKRISGKCELVQFLER